MTTYTYGFNDGTGGNEHGDLLSVSYNDGTTPTITFSYARRGQQTGIVRNGMTTTRQYDRLNRLQSVSSQPAASGEWPISASYLHNEAGQRIRCTLGDGTYWAYTYDALVVRSFPGIVTKPMAPPSPDNSSGTPTMTSAIGPRPPAAGAAPELICGANRTCGIT